MKITLTEPLGKVRLLFSGACIIIAIFTFTNLSFSQIFYVSSSEGSDSNPGTENQPWATIQKAADTIAPGDTVYIKAGTYQRFIVTKSGTASSPITYKAFPGDEQKAVITGASLRVEGAKHIIIDGLASININSSIAIFIDNSEYITIKNYKINKVNAVGIKCMSSSFIDIINSEISETGLGGIIGEGIYLGQGGSSDAETFCHDVTIRGNHLYKLRGEAVDVKDESYNVIIEGNVIHDIHNSLNDEPAITLNPSNGLNEIKNHIIRNNIIYRITNSSSQKMGNGIYVYDDALIYNNIIYDNSDYGIRIRGYGNGTVKIYHNTIFGNGVAPIGGDVDGRGGLSTDIRNNIGPTQSGNITFSRDLFVDADNGDYHLKSGSVAIDAGVDLGITTDFDGHLRPAGAGPDMGAYEFIEGEDTQAPLPPHNIKIIPE